MCIRDRHRLARPWFVSGEDVVERSVLADDDDDVLDRSCGLGVIGPQWCRSSCRTYGHRGDDCALGRARQQGAQTADFVMHGRPRQMITRVFTITAAFDSC